MVSAAASSAYSSVTAPNATQGATGTASRQKDQAALEQLAELAKTDQHVRSHEQAHMTAAGQYAQGGPSYQYVTGSDGKRYAVAGEVSIDTSPVPGNPHATAAKARVVENAARAPVDPSGQDQEVAAEAARMEQQAVIELALTRYGSAADQPGQLFSISG